MWRQAVLSVFLPLLLIIIALEMSLLGGMQLVFAREYLDPFAPFEAIMPGQPSGALSQYSCRIEQTPKLIDDLSICRIYPGEGPFYQIVVVFDHRILRIVFKTERLRVGDLIQRWGRPDVTRNGRGDFYIEWHKALYAVAAPLSFRGRFSYLLPVDLLVIGEDSV